MYTIYCVQCNTFLFEHRSNESVSQWKLLYKRPTVTRTCRRQKKNTSDIGGLRTC